MEPSEIKDEHICKKEEDNQNHTDTTSKIQQVKQSAISSVAW